MESTIKSTDFDIIIIGGGLAGLVSAIHLSRTNKSILLIEKNRYPKHKVCGEYISNEVLPYLSSMNIDPFAFGAQKIDRFILSTSKNKSLEAKLPLGGFGISRYTLDMALANHAKKLGLSILEDTVLDVLFLNNTFEITTKKHAIFKADIVIGAYGKRDALDIKLARAFTKKRSPYLAVKMHLKGTFSNDVVALHNFKGGYCGVSKVEDDKINLCYLANYKAFKKYKDLATFQKEVVFKNQALKAIFQDSQAVFSKPLTISQISFASKSPIEHHMIMCGDTAGMIHPLCGNGMSMAIRSAKIGSELILAYFDGKIKTRSALEKAYLREWNKEFKMRLGFGHVVAWIFNRTFLADILMSFLKKHPAITTKIIRLTHGKLMSAT